MTTTHTATHKGATDDWITPPHVYMPLGRFDLDPCACIPQPWPTATRMLTRLDDGLRHRWCGRVWLNPPYGPVVGEWLDRLATHGDGVALVFARTETLWFVKQIWNRADACLFLANRLYFYRPTGELGHTNSGGPSVLVAYGTRNVLALEQSQLRGTFIKRPRSTT